MAVVAFRWKSNALEVLDQRLLPHTVKYTTCRTHQEVAEVIRNMSVRGAPAIGCVAAYGMVLARMKGENLDRAGRLLRSARPTAVNLAWAIDRMLGLIPSPTIQDMGEGARGRANRSDRSGVSLTPTLSLKGEGEKILLREAHEIERQDLAINRALGRHGAKLLRKNSVVLTHCNTGALATAGHGTALGIIREAWAQGKIQKVFVDETRPYLQGARLTAWELDQEKIPHELITDSMAGYFMSKENVAAVFVGCDRVAANGDTANKIGTYGLAVLAKYHGVPFYVAMPSSTLDLNLKTGAQIPIEERSSDEVVFMAGKRVAPLKTKARHPAFDVTPASLITGIVTEFGIVRPPFFKNLKKLKSSPRGKPE